MRKKIICFLLIVLCSFSFVKVEAKEVKLYFLVNCEESRRRYRELTGKELTQSGGYYIDEDKLTDDLKGQLADSSSSNTCGPNISGKFACSFNCIEEAMNNVTSGNVYKAESVKDLLKVLDDAGVGSNVDGVYCREVCADKKKFLAPDDNSVVAKQGTRFTWLNSNGHILTLNNERNCTTIFDSKTWKSDYESAYKSVQEVNNKLRNDDYYENCGYGYRFDRESRKCINNNNLTQTYTLKCDSDYYESSVNNNGITCTMTSSYKNKLRNIRNESVTKMENLIKSANTCNNRVAEDYKPCDDVTISYDDEVYGPILDGDKDAKKLVRTGGSSDSSINKMSNENYYITRISSCDGDSCTVYNQNITLLKTKTVSYKSTYNWDLQDDLFRCVGIDGYSYLKCEIAENKLSGSNNYFGKYKNFIKLDSSNFPVNFNSKPTVHDIKINYNCDNATNNTCHYSVTECIGSKCPDPTPCDPTKEKCDTNNNGKIDIIYRTISLSNPFPNRTPGDNWNKNNYVSDYITNNRNVKEDEVYDKEPMYTIELTPSLIREIRNDNKSVNYGDLNLYCKDGNECRSEYIKELRDNGHLSGCGTDSNFGSCKAGDK